LGEYGKVCQKHDARAGPKALALIGIENSLQMQMLPVII
jgi:hypothetical protein